MSATAVIGLSVFAGLIGGAILWSRTLLPAPVDRVVSVIATKTGVMSPDELGWMDDAPLSDADTQRIATLSGLGYSDNVGVIRGIQAGARSSVSRRDFELLRQDRRRARAAYPDASEDDLYRGTWLSVDISARVPDSFCQSGNSNGTKIDGKWYLDGGCYISVVNPQYTNRADAETTKRILAQLKDAAYQKRLARIKRWGYSTSWSSTGGSGSVNCYPDPLPSNREADGRHVAGQCVVIFDEKTKYVFAFDSADWADPPYWRDGLEKLALSKGAVAVDYVPEPKKPWVIKDGALARGQTCSPGRLCRSMWNADKDDYDNTDIGPSDPASWVTYGIFGAVLGYVPAPDNGERRSDPNKPWFLAISYYGYPTQVSGGWTEQEAKDALPSFSTGMSYPMMGQDFEAMNRGNLREARATQIPPNDGIILKDRALPKNQTSSLSPANYVPYSPGMTLGPGQSTSIGFSR